MAFCDQCGSQLPDGANNCPACGASVNGGGQQQFQQQTQQQYQQQGQQQYQQQYQQAGSTTEAFLGKDHTAEYDPADINENKVACGFVYIPILFWLPYAACPNSCFGKFHANQGLVFLIACIAVSIVGSIFGYLGAVPFIGVMFRILSYLISGLGGLAELGMLIYGMVNTFGGKAVELPLIGRIQLIK